MTPLQNISSVFAFLCIVLAAYKTELETSLMAVGAFALVVAITYLEKSNDNELKELRDELKKIRDTVQALMVRAGLGR